MIKSTLNNGTIENESLQVVSVNKIPIKRGKLSMSEIRANSDDFICNLYLKLKKAGIRITESFLYGIGGSNRKVLKIPFCNGVKASSLNYFFFNSPNLEVINLSNCFQVNNRVIRCIIFNCKELKELNICNCKLVTDSAFKMEFLSPVGSCLSNLRVLNIEGCSQIIDIQSIIKLSRYLEVLNISCCRNIGISTLEDVIQCCVNLKELNISSCDGINDINYNFKCNLNTNIEKIFASRSKLSTKTLIKIFESMENLKVLDLNYSINMNDESLEKIISKLKKLNTLSLKSCANISDTSFLYLGTNLKELEHLDISWCPMLTSKTLKYLAIRYSKKEVKRLKTLKLSYCTNLGVLLGIDDYFLGTFDKLKIPKLSLEKQSFSTELNYDKGSNRTLQMVQTNYIELQNKASQDSILEESIFNLIRNANIESKLAGGGLIPLSMCLIIKNNSDSLINLELEGLKNVITSDVLEYIGNFCINLTSLSISIFENDDLCINSFGKICKECRKLQYLLIDISSVGSKYHHSSIISCIINRESLHNLKVLNLLLNPSIGISNKDLDLLSDCKFKISKLRIKNFRGFSISHIKRDNSSFIGFLSGLADISLSGNEYLNNDDVIYLLKMVDTPNFVELVDFDNVSADLPKLIWETFPSIKRLNVLNSKIKVFLER
ncbi:LRR protein [Cryptosporidium felis]|nr:LRR protein [Cryptosporidium felis]